MAYGRRKRSLGRRRRRKKGSYKRRQLRRIGTRPGTGAQTKQSEVLRINLLSIYNINTIYASEITNIEHGDEPYMRERGVVNLRGIRMRWQFKNIFTGVGGVGTVPLYCNMAIVSKRDVEVQTGTNARWFRGLGFNRRAINFDDITLSGLDRHTLPINSDGYAVVWHTRFQLGINNSADGYSGGVFKNWRTISRYCKINRQIRYADQTPASSENRIFLCWWFSPFTDGAGPPATTPGVEVTCANHVYFREPRR